MIVSRFKVRQRMNILGMENYTEITKKSGLHVNTIYNVMDNDNWNSRTVSRIATALECSPIELIAVEGDFAESQN